MLRNNIQRKRDCKTAGMEVDSQLESPGIRIIGHRVDWSEDENDFIITVHVHTSERNKEHTFPTSNNGFQVVYEYMNYPEFAKK